MVVARDGKLPVAPPCILRLQVTVKEMAIRERTGCRRPFRLHIRPRQTVVSKVAE